MLEKLSELIVGQASIADDIAHCVRVDRIVTRNGQYPFAVGHHDVFALARNPETGLL